VDILNVVEIFKIWNNSKKLDKKLLNILLINDKYPLVFIFDKGYIFID